jgi:hypothetical protein
MHAQALQLRHALGRSGLRAAAGHLRPLPPTNLAAKGLSSVAAAAEREAESDAQPSLLTRRPARTSNKEFNLLASAAAATDGGKKPRKVGVANGKRLGKEWHNSGSRKPSKWWKKMDRTSFRKLLDECMATGKVSSVLRKVCCMQHGIILLSTSLTSPCRLACPINSTWTSSQSRSKCGPRRSSS